MVQEVVMSSCSSLKLKKHVIEEKDWYNVCWFVLPSKGNFRAEKYDWWVITGTLKTNPSKICHINSFDKMTNVKDYKYWNDATLWI